MSKVIESLHALANENRIRILHLLKKGPHSTLRMAQIIGIRRTAVAQHLHILHRAGLVTYKVDGRNPQYSIVPEGFSDLRKYIEMYERLKNQ